MFSFEGEFRRRPTQALGGIDRVATNTRDELLREKQEGRRRRELSRKKEENSVKIQALARGFLDRRRIAKVFRSEVDSILRSGITNEGLGELMAKFVLFYKSPEDDQRLEAISQYLLKNHKTALELIHSQSPIVWTRKLKIVLMANLHLLRSDAKSSLVLPLRLIELYANVYPSLWRELVDSGYFPVIKHLILTRCPQVDEDCLKAPTALGDSLMMFIQKPLEVCSDPCMKAFIINRLFEELFGDPDILDCRLYHMVLPILANLSEDILSASEMLESTKHRTKSDTVWKLAALVRVMNSRLASISSTDLINYLSIIKKSLFSLFIMEDQRQARQRRSSESEEEEEMDIEIDECLMRRAANDSIWDSMNEEEFVQKIISAVESTQSTEALVAVGSLNYLMQVRLKHAIHKYPLLHRMAFRPSFIRLLWLKVAQFSVDGAQNYSYEHRTTEVRLIKLLASGWRLSRKATFDFLPLLTTFCNLFGHLLPTIYDTEFYSELDQETGGESKRGMMPFSLSELATIAIQLRDVAMGLIDLSFPESPRTYSSAKGFIEPTNAELWRNTFQSVLQLLRQLYSRDCRRKFCDGWILNVPIIPDQINDQRLIVPHLKREPFSHMESAHEEAKGEFTEALRCELTMITILQELPFVVPFQTRVKILHSLIRRDSVENHFDGFHVAPSIHIRRNYIYEDSFEKLLAQGAPNVKQTVRVTMSNVAGLEEAGVDGGGIFREFLQELLKTAFDINRGFFRTTSDNLFYPNPSVHFILPKFQDHYYFIGKMLGKAIYDSMLIELPLAEFFLSKLLARSSGDLDIHHLASLDPYLYKNLLYLKTYDGDVSDLALDFSITLDEVGQQQFIDLKPDGQTISVTNANRIEYIHLMADFKLNKQIRQQTAAFKQGLAEVIDPHWLQLFDANELQTLISGVSTPIDVNDWRNNTAYGLGYDNDNPVIQCFWEVISSFDEKQRRDLLRFCTSCSRPPLLGFKELRPSFCINRVESTERLPTSATCINLLKLPFIDDFETLKQKLLTAIQSGAGFELS